MPAEIFKLVGRIVYEGQSQVDKGLESLGKKVAAAQVSLQKFGTRVQETGAKMQEAGAKMQQMGGNLTATVSAPLAGLGVIAGAAANDADKAFGRIQAQTGKTAAESKALAAAAKDLWKNGFGESITDAADNIGTVQKNMQGLKQSDDQIKAMTKSAMIMSDAFGFEVGESTRAASSLMKNFGIDGTQAMDMITVATQKGGDYSQELLDTINEYAPQFQSMGMNANEMFNVLLQGAQNGAFNMDKVGDSIKEFNIRAQDGSKTTTEAFKAIGLDADQMGGAIAAGGEKGKQAFMATVAALSQIKDPLEQNAAGVALFGTQWEDVRGNVITAMDPTKDMLGDVSGATDKAGKALYDNFGDKWTSTMRKAQDALLPIGDKLLDVADRVMPKVISGVESLANWFTGLGPTGQNMVLLFGAIAAAAGPFLMVLGTLSMGIGGLIQGLGAVSKVFPLVINGAKLLGTALKFLTMSPIGMIITAIGLLVMAGIAIYKNWDVIKPKLLALWEGIKAGLQIAWDAIKNAAMAVFNGIKAYFTFVFNLYKSIITAVWNVIKAALSAVWNGIKAAAIAVFNAIKNTITTIFNTLKNGIINIWNAIKSAITATWNAIKSAATSVFNAIKSTITTIFNAAKSTIVSIWNSIKSAIVGVWNGIKSAATSVFNSIKSTITGIFNGIKSTASSIWNGIKSTITNVVSGIRSSVSSTFSSIKSAMTGPIQSARDTISGIVNKIKGFFTGLKLKIPKISMPALPHFNLSGKFSLKPPSVPKLSVDWYAKGGVFDGDSIIGVGEKGPEAVVPLTGPRMKPFAEAVGQEIPGGANGGITQTYNFYQPINRPSELMKKNRDETRRLANEMGMRT